jgi:hypothetical protein
MIQSGRTYIQHIYNLGIMKKTSFLASLTGLIGYAVVGLKLPALAASVTELNPIDAGSIDDLKTKIEAAVNIVIGVAGVIALAYLVFGGITYITGGEKGADSGKKIISNALVGLAIIALSYAIVNAVISLLQ